MHVGKTTFKSLFTAGLKKLHKQHKREEIKDVQSTIAKLENFEIQSAMDNHPLTGNYKGSRDLHIRPDLVLIYQYVDGELELQDLVLQNLGNHDEVFPKSKKAKQAIKKALK